MVEGHAVFPPALAPATWTYPAPVALFVELPFHNIVVLAASYFSDPVGLRTFVQVGLLVPIYDIFALEAFYP
jgi:hypothetical protein